MQVHNNFQIEECFFSERNHLFSFWNSMPVKCHNVKIDKNFQNINYFLSHMNTFPLHMNIKILIDK